jgi:excisionase family DNA binding protein
MEKHKGYLGSLEAQVYLGIGRSLAYQIFNRQDFPSIRIGRRLLVRLDALDQWMDAQSNTEVDRR